MRNKIPRKEKANGFLFFIFPCQHKFFVPHICAKFDSNIVNLFRVSDQATQKLAFSATFGRV
jgi:hypothetical protein